MIKAIIRNLYAMTMIKHNSNCALSCWQFANLNFQYEYK